MRTKEYRVELTDEERAELLALVRRGKAARTLTRAHLLLTAGEDTYDAATAAALHVSTKTVERVRHAGSTRPCARATRCASDLAANARVAVRASLAAHVGYLERALEAATDDLERRAPESPRWQAEDALLRSVRGVGPHDHSTSGRASTGVTATVHESGAPAPGRA